MTPPPNPPQHPGALNESALFAGAGGGILGGHLLGWRTVCAVERDKYAAAVLAQRQNDGALHPFPIWNDVCTFDGRPWRGRVDVISGGFPCQDISVAGGGAGLSGERSGLWREFARIIREVGPRYVFVENSPALAFRGLDVVLGDLAAMGYDAEWGVLGADDVGAPHKRERMWIVGQLADVDRLRQQQPQGREPDERGRVGDGGQESTVADAGHLRGRDGAEPDQSERPRLQDVVKWPTPNARDWKDTSITGSLNALQTENGQANLPRIVHARLLPTPKAGDGKRTDSPSERAGDSPGLSTAVAILGEQEIPQTSTGALNPSWVEWLMGWPIGWTDCEPLATDRFRSWQRSHGQNYIGD